MAYVSGFDPDVFVSYAHLDDRFVEGDVGWVTDFTRRLDIELGESLGHSAEVWRDARLGPASVFSAELRHKVRRTAVLLSIVSPAYVQSAWCDWELNSFTGSLRTGELVVDDKCRAIRIIKRPLGNEPHRMRILPEVKGIEFFDIDVDTKRPFELDSSSPEYRSRLNDLTLEIKDILETMRRRRTIFVGAAPPALQDQRRKVQQELEAREFTVLPPSWPVTDVAQTIRSGVLESSVCIHFVDKDDQSDRRKETESAQSAASEAGNRQVLVVRTDTSSGEWWQALSIGRNLEAIEVLVNPATHALKDTVLEVARNPRERRRRGDVLRVYLVCAPDDHPLVKDNYAAELCTYLRSRGHEVKLPLAEAEDASEFTRDDRMKLKGCDAVVLFWGVSRQFWFERRLFQLIQALGWRKRKFRVSAGYLSNPNSPIKARFETMDVDMLVKQPDGFDPEAPLFREFIAALESEPSVGQDVSQHGGLTASSRGANGQQEQRT